ncbi:MAG: hypothetical protein ACP5QU_04245 [Anaerolineae bacterium]
MQVISQITAQWLKKPAALVGGALIVGIVLGLIWGWWIDPVQFVDATPIYLRADLQEDYLRMTIDSFLFNRDLDLAVQRWQNLGANAPLILDAIQANPKHLNPQVVAAFRQLIEQRLGLLTPAGTPTPAPARAGGSSTILIVLAIVVIVAVVVGAALPLRRLLAKGRSTEVTPMMQAAEITRQTEKTNFEDLGLAPPITQTMTTYVLGDDLYNESFGINTQSGEFLGEYGMEISETIGIGDPKKVTAFEVWLFDKNDIRTATKVLMTEHAFNDPTIRSRLEPKGELVLVEPQKQFMLETETLQLLVTVVDLEYGKGPLPPNSYFERLVLELAVWPKGEQPAA